MRPERRVIVVPDVGNFAHPTMPRPRAVSDDGSTPLHSSGFGQCLTERPLGLCACGAYYLLWKDARRC